MDVVLEMITCWVGAIVITSGWCWWRGGGCGVLGLQVAVIVVIVVWLGGGCSSLVVVCVVVVAVVCRQGDCFFLSRYTGKVK